MKAASKAGCGSRLNDGLPSGKLMGKPWENHGNTMGTPWENGDLYGKLTVCYGKSPFLMGKSTTVFLLNGFFLPRRLFFTGAEM